MDISEIIATIRLKNCMYRQLSQSMKVSEFLRSRLCLPLAQCHLHMKIKTCFLRNQWVIFNQILSVSFKVHGNKQNDNTMLVT